MLFQFEIVTKKKYNSEFLLVLNCMFFHMLNSEIQSPLERGFATKEENTLEQTTTTDESVFEVHNNPVLETALDALSIIGKHKEMTIKKTRMT